MTVWAWDGKTLAADKMTSSDGLIGTVTKVFEHKGHLISFSGEYGHALEKVAWWKAGADPAAYPRNDKAALVVITPRGGILEYEETPVPLAMEDPYIAGGSGRELAIGAMAMGATAVQAVEVAIKHNTGCGQGIDFLELKRHGSPS